MSARTCERFGTRAAGWVNHLIVRDEEQNPMQGPPSVATLGSPQPRASAPAMFPDPKQPTCICGR